jgi:ribosome-associated protein
VSASDYAIEFATYAARAANAKLGQDICVFDVSEPLAIADLFVVVSAENERQVSAIVDYIEEVLLRVGVKPARREGEQTARWVLLDYLDFVVHVQHSEERHIYSLERLWKDCPVIDIDLEGPLPEAPVREED